MALLKAFVCQVIILGIYKLFLEQIFEDYLVPDELTRNGLVGFVCLLCFGIQLYSEKVEEQTDHAEPSKTKSRRRTPPDTAETVSEFLDERTVHMMRTLDAAMKHMGQMPMSDGYVQNVIFAAAGPEAAVIEQTFVKQPDVVVLEEVHLTKLDDTIYANDKSDAFANEPIVISVSDEIRKDKNETEEEKEEVEEEEIETKSDVCEEEEDVVTVIDASKPELPDAKTKLEATESEEEEEEEEEVQENESVSDSKTKEKIEEKTDKKTLKVEIEEEEEEEEEEESEEEEDDESKQDAGKVNKKS